MSATDASTDPTADGRVVALSVGPVWDLVRQGQRAAVTAGAHFPVGAVRAAGELRVAHTILAGIVPPLVGRDPLIAGYARMLADALRGAWDDPYPVPAVADALHARIMASPLAFDRPGAYAIKAFIEAGRVAPDRVRALPAARYACMCFTSRTTLETVRDWTPDRHIEVARALAAELHPVAPPPPPPPPARLRVVPVVPVVPVRGGRDGG